MDLAAVWQKTLFVLTHMTVFELPLVLLGVAAAAYGLALVLDKHNARAREATLARRVAYAYVGLLFFLYAARQLLK